MKIKETVLKIAKILDERKALDISVLDISKISSLCDYFVIASANSPRQSIALSQHIEDELQKENIFASQKEGARQGDWVIIDYIDIIVHIFTEEKRELYDLDSLWKEAEKLNIK